MKIFSFGCKIAEFVYFNDVIDEQQLYNVDNIKTNIKVLRLYKILRRFDFDAILL